MPNESEALVTADELISMPETDGRLELILGKLVKWPFLGMERSGIAAAIGTLLFNHVRERRLGVVLAASCGFALHRDPDTVRTVDCCFVARGRLPDGKLPEGFFPGPPDLGVLIASPPNVWPQIESKRDGFLDARTRLIWVVDPDLRNVRVYRSLQESFVVAGDETLHGEPVLPGLQIRMRAVFEE